MMKLVVFLTWSLLLSITNNFAAPRKSGGKTSGAKSPLNNRTGTKKERIDTSKKHTEDVELRKAANPDAKGVKQDIVDSETFNMAKVSINVKDVKNLEDLATYASGKNVSNKHKLLAESYISLLAEANEKFTVINTETVLSAVQKWGESEASNLGKIFQKTKQRVEEGLEINESFRNILKELGIEDAFKNFC